MAGLVCVVDDSSAPLNSSEQHFRGSYSRAPMQHCSLLVRSRAMGRNPTHIFVHICDLKRGSIDAVNCVTRIATLLLGPDPCFYRSA